MLPITCISLKSVDSTNSWARRNLSSFDPTHITVVWADSQTEGRGRNTNTWVSTPGENLYFSFCLSFDQPLFLLSQATSLAIQKTLFHNKVKALIKWPNDLVTTQGKIAGILIEQAHDGILNWAIGGVGINVLMQKPPQELDRPISSIYMETQNSPQVGKVLEGLLENIQYFISLSPEEIMRLWHQETQWLVGKIIKIWQTKNGIQERVNALVSALHADGQLICQVEGKEQTVSSADIFLLPLKDVS